MHRNLFRLAPSGLGRAALLLLLCCGIGGTAFAQLTVNGTVTSAEEGPLIGVTVRVADELTTGTITDLDGNYTITVPSGESSLILSYTGYETKTVPVNNQSVLNIVMTTDAETLDEVVVVGYGYVDKKDLTGSVSTVKTEDLTRVQSVNFERGLAAQASGVQVVQSQGGPGASARIRIRGGTSVNGSSDPLYVVDGFPLLGSPQSGNAGLGNSTESPLNSINPNDIESIEVLKDASSTAIYGSRGANGVIIITTKSGKEGRTNINYQANVGVSTLGRDIDILSPQEYVDFYNEFFPFNPFPNPGFLNDRAFRDDFGNELALNEDGIISVDWRDRVLRNATNQDHRISINGGNTAVRFNGSFGYTDQRGILEGSFYKRYSSNIRLDADLANRLKGGVNVNIGLARRGGPVTANGTNNRSGVLTNLLLFSPVQGRVRYDDAEYDEDGILISARGGDIFNPERQIETTHNFGDVVNGFANTYLAYGITDKLELKTTFGGNIYYSNNEAVYPNNFGWSRAQGGLAFTGTFRGIGWINENTLSYRDKIGIHGINAVVGYTQQSNENRSINTESSGFGVSDLIIDALETARQTSPVNSGRGRWGLRSFLGRINYTLNDKYLFTISGRFDESSRFGIGDPLGFFPSAAVGWRVSEEPFLQNNPIVSNLKLRATYGEGGNTEVPPYFSLAALEPISTVLDRVLTPGLIPTRFANTDLTWETTTQVDLGFELGLFNNRITLDFDYYDKQTRDLLLQKPVPSTSGVLSGLQNAGQVSNKGIELALSTVNVDNGKFTWTSRLNFSRNVNEVVDLGDATSFPETAIGANIQNDYIVQEGQPLGAFFGFKTDGVYTYDDFVEFDGLSTAEAAARIRADAAAGNGQFWRQYYTLKEGVVTRQGVTNYRPGMVKLLDITGVDENGNPTGVPDGRVNSEDRTILGTVQPDFFGGFTNDFTYGNFDLSTLFQFSVGNEVYNKNRARGEVTEIFQYNKYDIVNNRWTPENPTDYPSIWGFGDANTANVAIDNYVEDGSFLRLSNITLGYNIPSALASKATLANARVFVAVDNAFIITNYTGYDPDVNVGNNQLTPGLDFDSYPRQRVFRGGLSVTF